MEQGNAHSQYAPIYDALAAAAGPYVLPSGWPRATVDSDCRLLDDPAATLAQLATQFPAGELLASGVARQVEEGLAINPVLTAEDRGFIVLHKSNGTAFDIMTATGCVSGAAPVLKALHDGGVKRSIEMSPHRLLPSGKQCMRYLGHDPAVAQQVEEEIARLQADRHADLELGKLIRQAGQKLRATKVRLTPQLEQAGYHFHGLAIRQRRDR